MPRRANSVALFTAKLRGISLKFVDLRGQHKITLSEPVNFVGPNRDVCFAPAKADIGMMPLVFRQFTDTIHKLERLAKISKFVGLLQMMLIDDLPSADLGGQRFNLGCGQGRHSASARHTLAFS